MEKKLKSEIFGSGINLREIIETEKNPEKIAKIFALRLHDFFDEIPAAEKINFGKFFLSKESEKNNWRKIIFEFENWQFAFSFFENNCVLFFKNKKTGTQFSINFQNFLKNCAEQPDEKILVQNFSNAEFLEEICAALDFLSRENLDENLDEKKIPEILQILIKKIREKIFGNKKFADKI